MVASQLALCRTFGSPNWPALIFTSSAKAKDICAQLDGYLVTGSYVEFFGEDDLNREYGFLKEDAVFPLTEDLLPKKPPRVYTAALKAARAERAAIDHVIEWLMKAVRVQAPKRLSAEQWVGARVRAATHRIYTKAEKSRFISTPPTAFCTGTVLTYCPHADKHLVVFGERLQPIWTNCHQGEVELLLESAQPSQDKEQTQVQIVEEVKETEEVVVRERCSLCCLDCVEDEGIQRCTDCVRVFHDFCLPDRKLRPRPGGAPAKLINGPWKCFHCTTCFACHATTWTTPMTYWNVQRVDYEAKERWLLLCGGCLAGYKHYREFCTICYCLYPLAEELPEAAPGVEPMAVEEVSTPPVTEIDEKCMIQCNECNRWIHALCEGLDVAQYTAITTRTHPIWGDEYLCPLCRVALCRDMLNKLASQDMLGMFAEPVTEAVAANYYDVIRTPMDLSTMRGKCERGQYKALQAIRQDFELMCLNALVFNKTADEYWSFAARFLQKGLQLFEACDRRTKSTAYGVEAVAMVSKHLEAFPADQQLLADKPKGRKKSHYVLVEIEGSTPQEIAVSTTDEEPMVTEAPMEVEEAMEDAASEEVEEAEVEELPEEEEDQGVQLIIPTALTPSSEPVSFLTPSIFLLSAEEAVFQMHMDCCFICGSAGDAEQLLFCIDCGEAMHAFCSHAPSSLLVGLREGNMTYNWRCMNCKLCALCGTIDAADSDNLIFCESCDNAFHMHCLKPMLYANDENNWYCPTCVHCTCSADTWGFSRDVCICCSPTGQKEEPRNCITCSTLCEKGSPFFTCSTCQGAIHPRCCDVANQEVLFRSGQPIIVQCKQCAPQVDQVAANVKEYRILRALLENKLLKQAALKAEKKLFDYCDHFSFLPLTIIVWSTVRLMILDNSPARVAQNERYRMLYAKGSDERFAHTVMPSWLHLRSRKFLNYFRRHLKLAPVSPMSSGQLSGLHLLGMSPPALTSLGQLAAAFTLVSDAQSAHTMRAFIESVIVIIEVALIITRHRSQVMDVELLNFLFNFFSSTSHCPSTTKPSHKGGDYTVNLQPASRQPIQEYKLSPHLLRQPELVRIVQPPAAAVTDPTAPVPASASTAVSVPSVTPATPSVVAPVASSSVQPVPVRSPAPAAAAAAAPVKSAPIAPTASSAAMRLASYQQQIGHSVGQGQQGLPQNMPVRPSATSAPSAASAQPPQPQIKNSQYRFTEMEFNLVFSFVRDFLFHMGGLYATDMRAVEEFLEKTVKRSFTPKTVNLLNPDGTLSTVTQNIYMTKLKLLKGMQAVRLTMTSAPPTAPPDTPLDTSLDTPVAAASTPLVVPWGGQLLFSRQHTSSEVAASSTSPRIRKAAAPSGSHSEFGESSFTEHRQLLLDTLRTGYGTPSMAKEVADLVHTVHTAAVRAIECCRNGSLTSQEVLAMDEEVVEEVAPRTTEEVVGYHMVAPLRGWTGSLRTASVELQWQETRICCLCLGSTEEVLGRLLPLRDGGQCAHLHCLAWSNGVQIDGHYLRGAGYARDQGVSGSCHYCHLKGATVQCAHTLSGGKKRCRRVYHLPCAMAAACALLSPSHCYCALHATDMHLLGSGLELWDSRTCPPACVVVEENTTEEVLRQTGALRMGALTVINYGSLPSAVCCTSSHLLPSGYKGCRVFWSMTRPLTRCLYLLEVLYDTPEGVQGEYVDSTSEEVQHPQGGAVYRAVAFDYPRPLVAKCLAALHAHILQGVQRVNPSFQGRGADCSAFGLTPHQFFGLGVPTVRRALERLPGALACMLSTSDGEPGKAYQPSYVLPSAQEVRNLQRQCEDLARQRVNRSLMGSCRADAFVPRHPLGGAAKRSKLLSKGVEEVGDVVVDEEVDMEVERGASRAIEEVRRQRYLSMSRAYLANPCARLEVRKSRIHNWGLFATVPFDRDDVIVEYIGEKVRSIVADKREADYEAQGLGSCYLFRMDKEDIIDATVVGGMARFMNHCCEPNAYARVISCAAPGEDKAAKHIVIIAARDIAEGEEVTYDYKFPIEDKKLSCFCGAPKCSGSMN